MIRRPPRSTLFPLHDALPIYPDINFIFSSSDFLFPSLISALKNAGRYKKVGERSEEHTSELQSLAYLVCRLLLEKKKTILGLRRTRFRLENIIASEKR